MFISKLGMLIDIHAARRDAKALEDEIRSRKAEDPDSVASEMSAEQILVKIASVKNDAESFSISGSMGEDLDPMASKLSLEQIQVKIASARRDAEALKDRIKHKKVEAGDTPFSHVPSYDALLPGYSSLAGSLKDSGYSSLGGSSLKDSGYSSLGGSSLNDSAYSSSAHSYGTSSTMSSSIEHDEDWTKISDLAERRRIQNRIAQRNYRKKLKKRLEDLERRATSSSVSSKESLAVLSTVPSAGKPYVPRGYSFKNRNPEEPANLYDNFLPGTQPDKGRSFGFTSPQTQRLFSKKVSRVKRGLSSFVNGSRLSVLADTGSKENVISAAYVKERKIPISGSPSSFTLGNSTIVDSIGMATVDYAFAEEPSKITQLVCQVLPNCIYDLILGNMFLTATETLTKHKRRLSECVFSVVNLFHLSFLGNNSQRLAGTLADQYSALAVPDTGAERNVIDMDYALQHKLKVRRGPDHCGYLQFADGSFQETVGQVETFWTFESGKRVPIVFEVLENCCSDIILGEDMLWENDVFNAHSASMFSIAEEDEVTPLAPFGYLERWQKKVSGVKSKGSATKASAPVLSLQQVEEQRRREWTYRYGFDGERASADERDAEKARREEYKSLSRPNNPPRIPSIPSAPSSASTTSPGWSAASSGTSTGSLLTPTGPGAHMST